MKTVKYFVELEEYDGSGVGEPVQYSSYEEAMKVYDSIDEVNIGDCSVRSLAVYEEIQDENESIMRQIIRERELSKYVSATVETIDIR